MFSASNLLTAFDDALTYVQENLIFFIIVAACLLAVIIICTVLIVSGKKAKKQRTISETTAEAAESPTETTKEAVEAVKETPAEEPAETAEEAPTEEATETVEEAPTEEAAETVEETPTEKETEPSVEPAAVSEELTLTEAIEAENAEAENAETETKAEEEITTNESTVDTQEEPVFDVQEESVTPIEDIEVETESDSSTIPAEEATEEEFSESSAKTAYAGKWQVSRIAAVNADGEEVDSAYFFQLKASNGEALITSEDYTSLRGALLGIETFKTNIAKGNFKISISQKGKYIVKLLTNQGALLTQGEKYSTRAQALSAIASIKRFAETAVLGEVIQKITVPCEETTEDVERSYDWSKKGKWVIKKIIVSAEKDASYCFELRASNGQVLFTSEEYSSVAGLKNGIRTHKNNIEKGNIRAVITRNGDYILKIYTSNGMLLTLGEHYKSKQLCLNAIESVKRFAKSAELNLDNITE